jgi:hypothetical protein
MFEVQLEEIGIFFFKSLGCKSTLESEIGQIFTLLFRVSFIAKKIESYT